MSTVLLVDDNPIGLRVTARRLQEAGFQVETAGGALEALEKATQLPPDAVLSDVVMSELDGFALCERIRATPILAHVPVVLVTSHLGGTEDKRLAREVGASLLIERSENFSAELEALRLSLREVVPQLMGSDIDRYESHLRANAHHLSKLARQARHAEERYRAFFEDSNDALTVISPEGVILEVNGRWNDIMKTDAQRMVGRHINDFAAPGAAEANLSAYAAAISGEKSIHVVPLARADGKTIYMEFSTSLVEIDGEPLGYSTGHEVTERVVAERALADAEEKYRSLVERIPDVLWTCTPDGAPTFVTANVSRLLGYTADEVLVMSPATSVQHVHPDDLERLGDAFRRHVECGDGLDLEFRLRRKDGAWIWVHNRALARGTQLPLRSIEGMFHDVTEKRQLEESLRQAQKMEAIGELTGGVAHDFNNVLAAILSYSQFLIEDLPDADPRRADAMEIKLAGERAASLTRQLLAFSRRQVLEPRVLDLNATIKAVQKMLGRLIGEDVVLAFEPEGNLGAVRADPGQVEQVLMNLVVNARDAMPLGGRVTVRTANVTLDSARVASHATPVGKYVSMSVTDTGSGISQENLQRVFEPFFTTKEKGRGTGLGLSTCYGIIKQSGGFMTIESEPGHGATFTAYLPQSSEVEFPSAPKRLTSVDLRGTETVLVVEDDDRVRSAVTRLLTERGYRVLSARTGSEALALAAGKSVDLVLSDVIIPDLNGPAIVQALQRASPRIRALFMSGYTDHALLRDGALQSGINFIQKPFAPEALARKLRQVLDAAAPIVSEGDEESPVR